MTPKDEQEEAVIDAERLARVLWDIHMPFDTGMEGARKVARLIVAKYEAAAAPSSKKVAR